MEPQTEAPPGSTPALSAIEQYAAFPFVQDTEYQKGLADIMLGWSFDKEPTTETREEMLRRTRVFYFNKMTGNALTMDEARDYERRSKAPRVLSFAELKELIESGRVDQIPNNKFIPEKLSEEAPSQSIAPARKKPWEIAQESQTEAA
ncbi:hypothetical protein FA13DRAFT_1754360 [Coprinellus micaceus]|uniref:Uncharacterized protein n=1 Tax=Coprinellus micaceus TaxID=71717 RepID=A0A4Y7TFG2_COPMI|nr:hypothetical protein FA13DRAFT_1754360 [Coprinellus micaceus]